MWEVFDPFTGEPIAWSRSEPSGLALGLISFLGADYEWCPLRASADALVVL